MMEVYVAVNHDGRFKSVHSSQQEAWEASRGGNGWPDGAVNQVSLVPKAEGPDDRKPKTIRHEGSKPSLPAKPSEEALQAAAKAGYEGERGGPPFWEDCPCPGVHLADAREMLAAAYAVDSSPPSEGGED